LADEATLRHLTAGSLLLTALLAIPLCSIAIGTTFILKRPALAPWIAVALLAWQLQETTRRGLMAHLRHSGAILGDIVSYLGQSLALFILAATGHMNLAVAFATIAITSILAGIVQAVQLGLALPRVRETIALIPLYWRIGKWALLAHVTDASLWQALPWALAVSHGLEYAASFQAALNILNIMNPVMFGVSNVVIPACLRARQQGGLSEGWRVARRYAEWGFLALLPYYAVLLIWPHRILSAYYGAGSHYINLDGALRILVPAYLLAYSFAVVAAFFNGMQRPSLVFASELVGAVVLGLAIYLSWSVAVMGACLGALVIFAARTSAGFILLRRMLKADAIEMRSKLRSMQLPPPVPLTSREDLSKF
jgi:O-antigen/teichoic acid export membrane protein